MAESAQAVRAFAQKAASNPMRVGAGILILILAVVVWLLGTPTVIFLSVPVFVAALFPLCSSPRLTAWVDSWSTAFENLCQRSAAQPGKLAKYFKRPLARGSTIIWQKSQPIKHPHLRAGIRIGALLYFFGIMLTLLVAVAYVVIAVVVAIVVIAFILWALGQALSGPGSGKRTSVSRSTTDWLGNPKIEHYDDEGQKSGESRPTTDWLGNPKIEHYDAEGDKTGESRPTTDWLGSPKTEHYDSEGDKTGESHPTTDWLGNPKTEHYDTEGTKTGESRRTTDWLGNPTTEHFDEQ